MTTRGERQEKTYTTRGERLRRMRGAPSSPARLHHRSLRAVLPPASANDLRQEVGALRESLISLILEVEDLVNEIGSSIDSDGRIEEISPLLRKWMDSRYTLAP